MSSPNNGIEPRESELAQARLQQITRTNQLLIAVLVVLLIAIAGFGGWFFGREHAPAAHNAAAGVHPNCPFDLPLDKQGLVRGIRCSHGTLMVDAHCEEGHAMKRFILDLMQQKASDEEIKAALLRRYGDKVLAGREW